MIHKKSNDREADIIRDDDYIRDTLEDMLTDETILMNELVGAIYADSGKFEENAFMASKEFYETISNEKAIDIAMMFFKGEDLDFRGPANPERNYFRFNSSGNVESTNVPGEILIDEILDPVLDYVIDHLEDTYYPEDIADVIDDYLNDE